MWSGIFYMRIRINKCYQYLKREIKRERETIAAWKDT